MNVFSNQIELIINNISKLEELITDHIAIINQLEREIAIISNKLDKLSSSSSHSKPLDTMVSSADLNVNVPSTSSQYTLTFFPRIDLPSVSIDPHVRQPSFSPPPRPHPPPTHHNLPRSRPNLPPSRPHLPSPRPNHPPSRLAPLFSINRWWLELDFSIFADDNNMLRNFYRCYNNPMDKIHLGSKGLRELESMILKRTSLVDTRGYSSVVRS